MLVLVAPIDAWCISFLTTTIVLFLISRCTSCQGTGHDSSDAWLAPKVTLSWRGPKRPTPVLHLQLSLWPLFLVTVHTASTSLPVPAGFLTPYSTDKIQHNNDRAGGEANAESYEQTHALQSSRQLPVTCEQQNDPSGAILMSPCDD